MSQFSHRGPRSKCHLVFMALGMGIAVLLAGTSFVSAAQPAEVVPRPAPMTKPPTDAVPETTVTDRLADLIQFLMVLCDDKPVRPVLVPDDNICALSLHLTPRGIELLENYLKDPQALALFRQRAPQLSQLLPVLAAGAPLVREIQPQIQVVVARQKFSTPPAAPPSPILPAVAVIFEPKDQRQGKSLLLATYWSVIRGANDLAERDGTPRITMQSGKRGDAFVARSRFATAPTSDNPDEFLRYNFTPAIGAVGPHCVVSTSCELCNEVVDLLAARTPDAPLEPGPQIEIGVGSATSLVMDNLRRSAPQGVNLSQFTEEHLDEVTALLHRALKNLPERPRPFLEMAERIRDRRQTRLANRTVSLGAKLPTE